MSLKPTALVAVAALLFRFLVAVPLPPASPARSKPGGPGDLRKVAALPQPAAEEDTTPLTPSVDPIHPGITTERGVFELPDQTGDGRRREEGERVSLLLPRGFFPTVV